MENTDNDVLHTKYHEWSARERYLARIDAVRVRDDHLYQYEQVLTRWGICKNY